MSASSQYLKSLECAFAYRFVDHRIRGEAPQRLGCFAAPELDQEVDQ
jgi:hypothetical protein